MRDVPAGADWPVSGAIRVRAGDALHPAALSVQLSTRYANEARPSGEDVSYGRARLAIRMVEPDDVPAAERTLRRSIFKDTDGRIAQFNRRISLPISVALIRTPLTANQLSILLVAVGFYSGWLFSLGHYRTSLLAACLSLVASILDGSDGEIARYQKEAITGHRPTWTVGVNKSAKDSPLHSDMRSGSYRVRDPFGFVNGTKSNGPRFPEQRKLKTLEAKAFDTMGLEASATSSEIKSRYKELVKKHHPDANGGDRGSEERFRAVIQAYQLLKQNGFC